jgi:hypothetical protein
MEGLKGHEKWTDGDGMDLTKKGFEEHLRGHLSPIIFQSDTHLVQNLL